MVISSLVIEVVPELRESVALALESYEGVEIHAQEDQKVVITLERESVDDSYAASCSFAQLEGVTNVGLVYCNFEEDPKMLSAFERTFKQEEDVFVLDHNRK